MAFNYALRISAAAALLTGCAGGFQPSADAPKQASISMPADHSTSQMQSGATSGDLLYAAVGNSTVYAISLPQGQVVGKMSGLNYPWGLCSDKSGDVFVTEPYQNKILEYEHGGVTPIKTFNVDAIQPENCSWDPTTGNLAVVDGNTNEMVIVSGGRGTAQTFIDSKFGWFSYCAYDDRGNLFLSGPQWPKGGLTEFNTAAGSFTDIKLNKPFGAGELQWDGKYLAFAGERVSDYYSVYRVKISGSTGIVVGTTSFKGPSRLGNYTSIRGGVFVAPWVGNGRDDKGVDIWSYPSGGEPIQRLPRSDFGRGPIRGVTISVAK